MGGNEGVALGAKVGIGVGTAEGAGVATVGCAEGASVGTDDGFGLGGVLGKGDGATVGLEVGSTVGANVGRVGAIVGSGLGRAVGDVSSLTTCATERGLARVDAFPRFERPRALLRARPNLFVTTAVALAAPPVKTATVVVTAMVTMMPPLVSAERKGSAMPVRGTPNVLDIAFRRDKDRTEVTVELAVFKLKSRVPMLRGINRSSERDVGLGVGAGDGLKVVEEPSKNTSNKDELCWILGIKVAPDGELT